MLTRKQQELLLFIQRRLVENNGIAPSFDEMKDAVGLRSKSGIHRLITSLEERGFVRRLSHRARALEVTRLPDGTPVGPGYQPASQRDGHDPARRESAEVHVMPPRPALVRSPPRPVLEGRAVAGDAAAVSLPLYGRIAAGTPIEALRDPGEFLDVPAALLGDGEHYALTVSGDSMVEAGILDGDIAIVRRCERAETGAIVVALVEDGETTLKRLRMRGGTIALEPANSRYETRIFRADQVRIQGRLAALFRRY